MCFWLQPRVRTRLGGFPPQSLTHLRATKARERLISQAPGKTGRQRGQVQRAAPAHGRLSMRGGQLLPRTRTGPAVSGSGSTSTPSASGRPVADPSCETRVVPIPAVPGHSHGPHPPPFHGFLPIKTTGKTASSVFWRHLVKRTHTQMRIDHRNYLPARRLRPMGEISHSEKHYRRDRIMNRK